MTKRVGIGHNSQIEGDKLQKIVDRVLEGERGKAEWAEHIKEIYAEAKAMGLDVKTIRRIVKAINADKDKLREEKELLEIYAFALDPALAEVLS